MVFLFSFGGQIKTKHPQIQFPLTKMPLELQKEDMKLFSQIGSTYLAFLFHSPRGERIFGFAFNGPFYTRDALSVQTNYASSVKTGRTIYETHNPSAHRPRRIMRVSGIKTANIFLSVSKYSSGGLAATTTTATKSSFQNITCFCTSFAVIEICLTWKVLASCPGTKPL